MFTGILAPIDLHDPSSWRRVIPVAVAECRTHAATLHVMTVVPPIGSGMASEYLPHDYEERLISRAMDELRAFVDEFIPEDVKVRRIVSQGTVYEEILKASREEGCDLIVLASHRPELKDFLLGPNAARVVRHADCSVLVVRD